MDSLKINPGDILQLDKNRLICTDARNPDQIARLMDNQVADLIFLDPPYNVKIKNLGSKDKTGTLNTISQHGEFAMASGEMKPAEYIQFLKDIITNLIKFSKDGSIHYICIDWRHLYDLLTAGKLYREFKQLCVWNKDNGGMGSFYRSKHELILVFKNGKARHTNNFQLGQFGRYRTNVWNYPIVNSYKNPDRLEEMAMHPTVKPLNLVADAILDCSNPGEIILDTCAGSGTTLIAAEKTGRIAYVSEYDPKYCLTILRRWCRYRKKNGLDYNFTINNQLITDFQLLAS